MSNKQKILNYLADGNWKCFANADFFMKDDRTRIAELRKKGYAFESKPCDGRCGVKHDSKLVMRRLIATPKMYGIQIKLDPKLKDGEWWLRPEYRREEPVKQLSQQLGI